MLDWLGKMLDLPPAFLSCTPDGHGGGVIQGTASEATLVALLGAKAKTVYKTKQQHPEWSDAEIVSKLVGYASGWYLVGFSKFCCKKYFKNLFLENDFVGFRASSLIGREGGSSWWRSIPPP